MKFAILTPNKAIFRKDKEKRHALRKNAEKRFKNQKYATKEDIK